MTTNRENNSVRSVSRSANNRYRYLLPLGFTLILWGFSSMHVTPQLPTPNLVGVDKLAHFLVYGLMGTVWTRAFPFRSKIQCVLAACAVIACSGMIEEFIQYMNPYRSFEWADWVADVSGATLAVILYQYWGWYRSILELKIGLLKR
jgi:VanZ family protein